MNSEPMCFVAPSTQEVVEQIRSQLGPEAVVLHARPVRPAGLARFWRKSMIEVLACRPQPPVSPQPSPAGAGEDLAELCRRMTRLEQQLEDRLNPNLNPNPNLNLNLRRITRLEQQLEDRASTIDKKGAEQEQEQEQGAGNRDCHPEGAGGTPKTCRPALAQEAGQWRIGPILQRSGLLPIHAQSIVDQLRAREGDAPPVSLAQEIGLARDLLAQLWRPATACASHSLHVLIGAPGSGKTTCLCKWLSQVSLGEGRLARVWRLDGATANLAQNLSVYCEVLRVPVNRCWEGWPGGQTPERLSAVSSAISSAIASATAEASATAAGSSRAGDGSAGASPGQEQAAPSAGEHPSLAEDIGWIDLPGVDWRDGAALEQLAQQLKHYGSCQVHLVVNAAYDTPVLLAQIRAFASLPISDLIITHLDEERRWGKIWNLALGTNYTVRYLSTGQNIPGDFQAARAESILEDQFGCK